MNIEREDNIQCNRLATYRSNDLVRMFYEPLSCESTGVVTLDLPQTAWCNTSMNIGELPARPYLPIIRFLPSGFT